MIEHIIAFFNEKMEKDAGNRRPSKMHEVVTTYYAIVLMKRAWDLVPTAVFKRLAEDGHIGTSPE